MALHRCICSAMGLPPSLSMGGVGACCRALHQEHLCTGGHSSIHPIQLLNVSKQTYKRNYTAYTSIVRPINLFYGAASAVVQRFGLRVDSRVNPDIREHGKASSVFCGCARVASRCTESMRVAGWRGSRLCHNGFRYWISE